jgi:hypothetical protein
MPDKKIIDALANRAYLSVAGKAIIGLFFGITLTIISFFRNRDEKEFRQEINKPESWIRTEILNAAIGLKNNSYMISHYASLGVDSSHAIYVNEYLKQRIHGALICKLNQTEIDSVTKLIQQTVDSNWTFRIENRYGNDFILVVRNYKLQNIISSKPIDRIIYTML